MIRIGLVDFDTSHVEAFTQRFNHLDVAETEWVNGARVVAGCPGDSRIMPERIPGYTEKLRLWHRTGRVACRPVRQDRRCDDRIAARFAPSGAGAAVSGSGNADLRRQA